MSKARVDLSNKQFIVDLLGSPASWKADDAWPFISAIGGDPTGGPFPFRTVAQCKPDLNNFFCISRFKTGKEEKFNRQGEHWHSLHALVIDDVKSKLDPGRVKRVLGDPTYILETSKGNYHYGYVLSEAVTDRAMAEALTGSLSKVFGIADMAGVNRLVRLPVGSNTKPKHKGFECRLVSYDLSKKLHPGYAAKRLKADPTAVKLALDHAHLALPLEEDPIYLALVAQGMVIRVQTRSGKVDVRCPWGDMHTDNDPSGSTYIPPKGFKCHHGHCESKTFKDLRMALGISANKVDKGITEARVRRDFGVDPTEAPVGKVEASEPGPEPETYDFDAERDGATAISEFDSDIRDLFDFETGELAPLPPREWLFEEMILRDTAWMIAGEGGVGKSKLLVALAIAIATGRPFGPFVPREKGSVLILSKEDDRVETARRIQAQYTAARYLTDPNGHGDWTDSETRDLFDHIVVPRNIDALTLDDSTQLHAYVRAAAERRIERMGEGFRLVVVDPLGHFWDYGENDQTGLNSTKGAFVNIEALKQLGRAGSGRAPHEPREDDPHPTSVVAVHHLNKLGSVTGSKQIVDYHRAALMMEHTEATTRSIVKITLAKVNYTANRGESWRFEHVHDEESVKCGYDGALWPAEATDTFDTHAQHAIDTIHASDTPLSRDRLISAVAAEADCSRADARKAVQHLVEMDSDALDEIQVVVTGSTKRPKFESTKEE